MRSTVNAFFEGSIPSNVFYFIFKYKIYEHAEMVARWVLGTHGFSRKSSSLFVHKINKL